jgi:hypothetical protein
MSLIYVLRIWFPGRLEFGTLAIHEVVVLDAVIVDDQEAPDISLPGDGVTLGGGDAGLLRLRASHRNCKGGAD